MGKDLVLYFTKNNTTQETVEKIENKANSSVEIVNIAKARNIDFSNKDKVFIGTGIYMGGIPGKVKKFIAKYQDELKKKEVVFFLHGIISQDLYNDIVYRVIDGKLDKNKVKIMYLGGKLDITKQNFLIRKLLIEVAKQNNFDPYKANTIDNEQINKLLELFK